MDRINFLILNREEAYQLVGRKVTTAKLIAALHRLGPQTVIITDGDAGACGSDNDQIYSIPAFPTEVVSKTGAGDAFASGCITALMNHEPLPVALRWGTANATAVVEEFGAQVGLCTPAKLQRILRRFGDVTPQPLRV